MIGVLGRLYLIKNHDVKCCATDCCVTFYIVLPYNGASQAVSGASLFYLDGLHAVGEDEVNQFVAGIVGLGGDAVQFREGFFPDADSDDAVAIFAPLLYLQRLIVHIKHPFTLC